MPVALSFIIDLFIPGHYFHWTQVLRWSIETKRSLQLLSEMRHIHVDFKLFEETGDSNSGKIRNWTQPSGKEYCAIANIFSSLFLFSLSLILSLSLSLSVCLSVCLSFPPVRLAMINVLNNVYVTLNILWMFWCSHCMICVRKEMHWTRSYTTWILFVSWGMASCKNKSKSKAVPLPSLLLSSKLSWRPETFHQEDWKRRRISRNASVKSSGMENK